MNVDNQLVFFFSALGAFNSVLLTAYFAFFAKKKQFSNSFLVLLLFALSIRVIKSVFFYFNPQLSGIFIQIGLSACSIIGPSLYLYLKCITTDSKTKWRLHIFSFLLGITVLGTIYPYVEHTDVWKRYIVIGIYLQGFVYIWASFKFIRPAFQKLFLKKEKLSSIDIWLLSIFFGLTLIWLGYSIASYTSYIVGALSFSFILYLILFLLVLKIRTKPLCTESAEVCFTRD